MVTPMEEKTRDNEDRGAREEFLRDLKARWDQRTRERQEQRERAREQPAPTEPILDDVYDEALRTMALEDQWDDDGLQASLDREERAEIITQYLSIVREIPQAVQVRLAQEDEGECLITVIDAEPFDQEPRDRVLEAEIQTYRRMYQPILGFRLVNPRRSPGADHHLPQGETLWERNPGGPRNGP